MELNISKLYKQTKKEQINKQFDLDKKIKVQISFDGTTISISLTPFIKDEFDQFLFTKLCKKMKDN